MPIIVYRNDSVRKVEYDESDDEFVSLKNEILSIIEIDGNITGVSHDGGSIYGLYLSGMPTTSPVNLNSVTLDPKVNNLISFKIDSTDLSNIRVKTYSFGNTRDMVSDHKIVVTGEYLNEDAYTIYYPSDKDIELPNDNEIILFITKLGFSATTYTNGNSESEDIYSRGGGNEPKH